MAWDTWEASQSQPVQLSAVHVTHSSLKTNMCTMGRYPATADPATADPPQPTPATPGVWLAWELWARLWEFLAVLTPQCSSSMTTNAQRKQRLEDTGCSQAVRPPSRAWAAQSRPRARPHTAPREPGAEARTPRCRQRPAGLSQDIPSPSLHSHGSRGGVRPWRWQPCRWPWLAGGHTSQTRRGRAGAWRPGRRPAGRSSSSSGSR